MSLPENKVNSLYAELAALDEEFSLQQEGRKIKTSDCYYLGTDPLHVLFNTNCPDELRERINAVLSKYAQDESSPSK